MPPYSKAVPKRDWHATMRLLASGSSSCLKTTSSTATSTTTSGRWATQVLAVLAQRFMSILVLRRRRLRCLDVNLSTKTIHRSLRYGTSCSCSTTVRLTARSKACLLRSSTPVWASSVWFVPFRARLPTTTPMCSSRSSRCWATCQAASMVTTRRRTSLCVWLLTTCVPSPSPLPTVSCRLTPRQAM